MMKRPDDYQVICEFALETRKMDPFIDDLAWNYKANPLITCPLSNNFIQHFKKIPNNIIK